MQRLSSALRGHTVSAKAFLRLTQVELAIVALNVVSGAAVRLTDSGLGCPDWPTCSQHHLTPPLSFHPAVEFANRMVVVALCIGAAAVVVCAVARIPRRTDLIRLSWGLTLGIVAEAGIGAFVVYSKLNPYVVMTHFMVGIGLLTLGIVVALRAGRAPGPGRLKVSKRVLRLSWAAACALLVAVLAGTATTAAGPHAGGAGAKRLPVPLADMARTHSGIVLVTGALTLALVYLLESEGAADSVRARARLLLAAMVVQGLIGYTQYFTHLPAFLVGVHVLGAVTVWTTMCWFLDGLWHHAAEGVAGGPVGGQPATEMTSGGSARPAAPPSVSDRPDGRSAGLVDSGRSPVRR